MPELRSWPVAVAAPATSANLGPGFDALGLGLGLYDRVEATATAAGLQVEIEGVGADDVPRDEGHLVVRAMRAGFSALGVDVPGLRLSCHNVVPHGRGLGSSSAAIVAGLRLAEALVAGPGLSDHDALALATRLEGHPDNVAACLFGGLTVAWIGPDGPGFVRLEVHPDVRPVVFVPELRVSTELARGLLPSAVSHADASANAARSALVVAALTAVPGQLLAGTEDRLHQEYRRAAMPASLALVDELRAAGIAGVVSGAGPSVMALGTAADPVDTARWAPQGWQVLDLPVDTRGARVVA